ncbi:hypothetical protein NDU88_003272 [Pleurodeles waltl]|uniref:Uncharacterized protein n=1 Tax=Pleurodeles waltl TaxID=8319 RepID=A0AAV7TQR6_PLEWA|nr:hypothetical protein NDU88_003272 [Pleurodeles waltl]
MDHTHPRSSGAPNIAIVGKGHLRQERSLQWGFSSCPAGPTVRAPKELPPDNTGRNAHHQNLRGAFIGSPTPNTVRAAARYRASSCLARQTAIKTPGNVVACPGPSRTAEYKDRISHGAAASCCSASLRWAAHAGSAVRGREVSAIAQKGRLPQGDPAHLPRNR